jgi:hypothetical protein
MKRKPNINKIAQKRIEERGTTAKQSQESPRKVEASEMAKLRGAELVLKTYRESGVSVFSVTDPKWEKLYEYDEQLLGNNEHVVNYQQLPEGAKKKAPNVGYRKGIETARSQSGSFKSPRSPIAPELDNNALIKALMEIAEMDPLMAPFEREKRSKILPYDRPEFTKWCDQAADWYSEVTASYDPILMKIAMDSLINRLRTDAMAAREISLSNGHEPFVDSEGNLIPIDLKEGYDKTTKGKNFGFPFFTSKWSGSKEINPSINDYMLEEAEEAIKSKEYFNRVEPIAVMFSRVARGKVRPIVCPSKTNALLGRMIFEPVISLFKASTQFCGFLGGENIGEIVADVLSDNKYWVELDLEGHDKNAKALVPLALEVMAGLFSEEVHAMLASWLEFNAKIGILTPAGITYPKTAGQLMGIISGDTFTSVLGGLVAALAMEYATIGLSWEQKKWRSRVYEHDAFKVTCYFETYANHLSRIINGENTDPMECEFVFPLLCDRLNACANWSPISLIDRVEELYGPSYAEDIELLIKECREDHDYYAENTGLAYEKFPLFTFGDDGLMASNSKDDVIKLLKLTKETGVVINMDKTYICENAYHAMTVDDYDSVSDELTDHDPYIRASFLGWHYFGKDVYTYKVSGEIKPRFSVARSIIPKLVYREYSGDQTNVKSTINTISNFLSGGNFKIPYQVVQDNIATIMKLDLARNNDCFKQLVEFVRKHAPLKLNTSLIMPYEQVLESEAIRETIRISRDRLRSGLQEFPVVKILHELELEEGIVTTIPNLLDEYGHSISTREGDRPTIQLYNTASEKLPKQQRQNNQTSRAEKFIVRIQNFIKDVEELKQMIDEAAKEQDILKRMRATARLRVKQTMLFGKNGNGGERRQLIDGIRAKNDESMNDLLNMLEASTM